MLQSARSEIAETSLAYPGWRVVVLCFAMAVFAWGFGFYGQGLYLAELQREHGWPVGLIAGASTFFYLCSAIMVAFVSNALELLGPRRLILGGVLCLATSALILPHVAAPWQLYLAYVPMSLGWASLSLGAITNILSLWFHEKRGLAISLALNGASLSGVLMVPALVLLVEWWGFASAMTITAFVMAIILTPLTIVFGGRPSQRQETAATAAADAAAIKDWSKRHALLSWHFWAITAPFALVLFSQVGFLVHQITFLSPLLSRTAAGLAVAVTAAMAVIGRVGLGVVIDRLNQRLTSAASFASQAAALIMITQTTSPALLLAACAVFGFSVGNVITFPALIVQREFPPAAFGTLVALSIAIAQFTYAFGPGLVGIVRDMTGGYAIPFAGCAVLNMLAAFVIMTCRPRPS